MGLFLGCGPRVAPSAPHLALPKVGLREPLLGAFHRRGRQRGGLAVAAGEEPLHRDPPGHHREAAPRGRLRPNLAQAGLRELFGRALVARCMVVLLEVCRLGLYWRRLSLGAGRQWAASERRLLRLRMCKVVPADVVTAFSSVSRSRSGEPRTLDALHPKVM